MRLPIARDQQDNRVSMTKYKHVFIAFSIYISSIYQQMLCMYNFIMCFLIR